VAPKLNPAPLEGSPKVATPECHAEVQVSVPALLEVQLGHKVSISCTHTTEGHDGLPLVEWFIVSMRVLGRRIMAAGGVVLLDTDKNGDLVIKAAEVIDERAFSCQVTAGAAGSGMGVTQLKVYGAPEAPEVIPNSRTLSVTEEDASEIATCTSKNANPVPTISWYKDGRSLNASTERNKELYVVSRTVKEASGLLSVSSTLYLRVNKSDKYSSFLCHVSYAMPHGKVGTAESDPFHLTLHYFTENVQFSVDSPEVIKEGDNIELQCQADGYPPPEYHLLLHGRSCQSVWLPSNTSAYAHALLGSLTITENGINPLSYKLNDPCCCTSIRTLSIVSLSHSLSLSLFLPPPLPPVPTLDLDPLVLNPNKTVMGAGLASLGGEFHHSDAVSCFSSPIPLQGKTKVGDGETLPLSSLSYDMAGGYTCEASVPSIPGLQRTQTVEVVVEAEGLVGDGHFCLAPIMKEPGGPPWGVHDTNREPPQKRPVVILPPSRPLVEETDEEGPQRKVTGSRAVHVERGSPGGIVVLSRSRWHAWFPPPQ
uniref:Ig-like domain-containing protein n=1 Tax=Podarcis muralis TaxID=64176 RepID=A0A670IU80_PODMU